MKFAYYIYCAFVLFTFDVACVADYSICFIHIGNNYPRHLETAVSQARLFNKNCDVFVLMNSELCARYEKVYRQLDVTLVELEGLAVTPEHECFSAANKNHHGFWRVTTERFLYLYNFIATYNITNIFHLENDNMLYVNLEELLPIFNTECSPISATFDNDYRVIAGFIYIRNQHAMKKLASFLARNADDQKNDMQLLALFKYDEQSCIGHLPIIMAEYAQDHTLVSSNGNVAQHPSDYFVQAEQMNSIFDAAAIGQFLGGLDPIHPDSQPGFINERCIFNPSILEYVWDVDPQGRKVPYALYRKKKFRINNLHIHSKNLEKFSSV